MDKQPEIIKILLIEDDPEDVMLISEMLASSKGVTFDLEHVNRLSSGLERLAKGGFDLVLSDLGLPDSQGLDTFLEVQRRQPKLPIVVLTGLGDESVGVSAVRRGAQDYLIKGEVNSSLLIRSIHYQKA
ncbi:response regulator [bacterium]|nr:response regulator [bacterium]